MERGKDAPDILGQALGIEGDIDPQRTVSNEKKGTTFDQRDMVRMGKPQQMRRNFRFITIFGFTMVLMATWEGQLTANTFGLTNGSTGGLIWVFLAVFAGFMLVTLSMAEMASMAPTSGGQYHWVSEFAPRSSQRFLSYVIGWLCVLGWQVTNASIAFITGIQLQGLIVLNYESYVFERWHGTMLAIAVATVATFFNTFLARRLPLVEGLILILHVFGFFAILIVLWVMAPRGKASDVFFHFEDGGGWGNQGLSCLVGMLSAAFSFTGVDSAAHLSEEIRDASYVLPRAMISTSAINGCLGFIMILTFSFCLGDAQQISETPTGFPYIQVLYNTTRSKAGASVLTAMIITLAIFAAVTNVATTSRQLFAFARDKGVPFSDFLSYVRPGWDIPLNAILTTYVIAMLLTLINIGSNVAFNIITSLGTSALMASYVVSVSCVLTKRLRGEPLLLARLSLGRWGLPINVIAVAFLCLIVVMTFFPQEPLPSPADMNWNILIFGVICAFSLIYFVVVGRKRYEGPVTYIKKDM